MELNSMIFRRSSFYICAGAFFLIALLAYDNGLVAAPLQTGLNSAPASKLLRANFYETSSTSKEIEVAGLSQDRYKPVGLAEVMNYSSTTANNFVITTGTVVGLTLDSAYQLVLGDGAGHYVIVTVAGPLGKDTWGAIYKNLRIGNIVEVKGIAAWTQGVMKTIPNTGATLSYEGDLTFAPRFGSINLTGIRKIK
jgi:hypothetical protein